MKTLDRLLLGCGLLIPVWLLMGVTLTAAIYPGYSHLHQAMSQLGAVGAPTQGWSALLNNFPLGGLFALFAWGLARRWRQSNWARLSALLVLVHALGSIGTGWFACDQGCAPAQPSFSQQMHNLSGLLMFLSLTLASLLWSWLGKRVAGSASLAWWSLVCTVLAIVSVILMAQATHSGEWFGLYQRLNYGVSVIWIAILALYSLRSTRRNPLRMAII